MFLSRAAAIALILLASSRADAQLLRVGVAGMNHDHVHGILQQYKRNEVIIAGIAEPDQQLIDRYKKQYQLPDSLFYRKLDDMLSKTHPDAVLAYNPISEHLMVIETCARRGVSVMVEKPLATTVQQAELISKLAADYHIHVLTNYETTWYATNQHLYALVGGGAIGDVRKMIVHDGHQGPKEIGCSPDFLKWLTDPEKNGGGALVDFGCYGANLMTWMMNGKAPRSVSAITRHIKPDIYPKVDDEATIVLEYESAVGIIEASWNWPFGIKDFEVYGQKGYLHALNGKTLQQRQKDVYENIDVPPPRYDNNLKYLADVLHGNIKPGNDLSSLENNVIVVRILEAARRSARSGKKVVLK